MERIAHLTSIVTMDFVLIMQRVEMSMGPSQLLYHVNVEMLFVTLISTVIISMRARPNVLMLKCAKMVAELFLLWKLFYMS